MLPLPELESVVMGAKDKTHPARLGREARMLEEAASEGRGLIRRNVEPDQSVGRVAERTLEEVLVAREKGGLLEPVQHGQDVIIADTQTSQVVPNHPAADTPSPQEVTLV